MFQGRSLRRVEGTAGKAIRVRATPMTAKQLAAVMLTSSPSCAKLFRVCLRTAGFTHLSLSFCSFNALLLASIVLAFVSMVNRSSVESAHSLRPADFQSASYFPGFTLERSHLYFLNFMGRGTVKQRAQGVRGWKRRWIYSIQSATPHQNLPLFSPMHSSMRPS